MEVNIVRATVISQLSSSRFTTPFLYTSDISLRTYMAVVLFKSLSVDSQITSELMAEVMSVFDGVKTVYDDMTYTNC